MRHDLRTSMIFGIITFLFCFFVSFQQEGKVSVFGKTAEAQSIITNCNTYGRSVSYGQSCPSGKQLYGGSCYSSCPDGWTRSAVCTCYRRECSSSCWDRPTTDCGRFSSVFGKGCPGGWRRTAVCTCVQRVCNNHCADRPVTNCSLYGNATSPSTGCPSGYENYGGRCYYACPSGYRRTAVCSCEQSGWHQKTWDTIKQDATQTIQKTGNAFASAYDQANRWTGAAVDQLKVVVEREAEKLAQQFVYQPDRKLRVLLSNATKVAIMTAQKKIQENWDMLLYTARQNRKQADMLYTFRLQAQKFSYQFSPARMAERARGLMSKNVLKLKAQSALKITSLALLLEAGAAAGGVVAYAALECTAYHGSTRYGACFEAKALEALKYALFDVMIAVAFSPIDLQILTPAAIQLAAAVTAAVAAFTGGVGAAVTGVIIALASKIAVTMVVMQEAEKLFPYYATYMWDRQQAIKNQFVSLFRSIGAQLNQNTWRSTFRGGAAGSSSPSAPSHTSSTSTSAPALYAARADALLWYQHVGSQTGSASWGSGSGRQLSTDDRAWRHVFASSEGVIYGVLPNGDLLWFRHTGYRNGADSWAEGSGSKVGSGWAGFRHVFATSEGVIYGVLPNGSLRWYRHTGYRNGSVSWAGGVGRQVGSGWGGFQKIAATSRGVIYAIRSNGQLLWYRHFGYLQGTPSWSSTKIVGSGWGGFSRVFASSHGLLYATTSNGSLRWYRHAGWMQGTTAWASNSSRQVGNGWSFSAVFANIEP